MLRSTRHGTPLFGEIEGEIEEEEGGGRRGVDDKKEWISTTIYSHCHTLHEQHVAYLRISSL